MNDQLRDLLRSDAERVEIPVIEVTEVIADGEQRLRRRRWVAVAGVAATVATVVVGATLAVRPDPSTQGPGPVGPPPSSTATDGRGAARSERPLVYASGSTVHVGDRSIQVQGTVAFVEATDDGAVYEASLDGTLWFTDGKQVRVLGTSGCTACPTPHLHVVTTSDVGSLVVWADLSDRPGQDAVELVAYDTHRGVVARIPFPRRGAEYEVLYVGDHQVWFAEDDGTRSHVFRHDVQTGRTERITIADLHNDLRARARVFTVPVDDPDTILPGLSQGASFRQIQDRLVTTSASGDPETVTLATGDQIRLRLPPGYRTPRPDSPTRIAQWLDDDTVVVWSNAGGGDGPRQYGDLLVCRLPDGTCRIEVPMSSARYVAPVRG